METMRWILLLAGIIIVLGIYLFSRLQGQRSGSSRPSKRQLREAGRRIDPLFDTIGDKADVDAELESLGQLIAGDTPRQKGETPATAAPAKPAMPDKVVTLFVMAPPGVPFRGSFLMEAMAKAGLEFGDMQIFHYLERHNGRDRVLFSVANLVEPGSFDPHAMDDFSTRGLVLFLQLPAAFDALKAFDAMVAAARSLATSLEGNVCDSTHSVLTNQTIGHMREDVIDYQFRRRVAQTAS
ncbi:MAG: cell division protein ZipA [Gammaproteobacteria bacterium]|nr:cell division protein ZipA [Gammaproteobacteria bacterium]